MKEKPKLQLTSQQNSLFETVADNVNFKYYYFPKVYIKLDNNTYQETDFSEIPKGIQEYINNKNINTVKK